MPSIRILITGSRDWRARSAVYSGLEQALKLFPNHRSFVLVHGAARGADKIAEDLWLNEFRTRYPRHSLTIESHPAKWTQHGPSAGPKRNSQMVKAGADVCVAFPIAESRGTRDCMRKAVAAGIQVINCGDKQ